MYSHIETDRLFIRPITLEDKEFILTLTNTKGWLTFIGDRNIKTSLDAENYIQKILDNKNYFYSVFALKQTTISIGLVTFLHRENQTHPDFGFAMLPDFGGQGYAYEASQAYLSHILQQDSNSSILGLTKPDNVKSIQLLTKLGFEYANNQINDSGETLAVYKK